MPITNFVFLIINNQNLPSADNDRRNLSKLFPNDQIIVAMSYNEMNDKYKKLKSEVHKGDNIFIVISSHGGTGIPDSTGSDRDGINEFIMFNQHLLMDNEFNQTLLHGFSDEVNIYALVDTCHSGTMLDLPYIKNNLCKDITVENKSTYEKVSVMCISACSDSQQSMDDFSVYGLGGGLISAFIDIVLDKKLNTFNHQDFLLIYYNVALRLAKISQSASLCCSNITLYKK